MLASLIASVASGEAVVAVKRAKRRAIAYVLASILLLCGLGFLVGAAYIWTARRYGPLEAALGFGGGFIALGLIVIIVHVISSRTGRRREVDRRKADLTAIGVATALGVLPGLLKGKGGLGVVIAPVVALAAYAIYRENTRRDPDDPNPL